MVKVALITGISGQDGSYLAEFLLEKKYEVHGIIRRSSSVPTARIEHIFTNPHLKLHYGDMCDGAVLQRLLYEIKPDEIYNLAAQSHVRVSFDMPQFTAEVDGIGVLKLLEAIRACDLVKKTKFYQASTSELYGDVLETPQKETTQFNPQSPYAIAKMFAYYTVRNYKDAYNMFAVNGILFNHESPRRGITFVTRKIARAVARIYCDLDKDLALGNLNASRDWGHARDYIEGMWLMLQTDQPEDFVLATGETHTVREFVEKCFSKVGLQITWKGEGINEKGIDQKGRELVRIDERYFRPTEVELLLGDATKAKEKLGWVPKISFEELVDEMLHHEFEEIGKPYPKL